MEVDLAPHESAEVADDDVSDPLRRMAGGFLEVARNALSVVFCDLGSRLH